MAQTPAQITAQVYDERVREGRPLTVPPDELNDEADMAFWAEVERRIAVQDEPTRQ